MADPRLDDAGVEQRLGRLEELLDQVEAAPGPAAGAALEAVQTLTEIYGEALARIIGPADEALARRLAADELVGHLLVLHEIHPEPVESRVRRALDSVRGYVSSHGGAVELAEIDGTVARIRMSGTCGSCSSSAVTLEHAVTDAVLALAPELTGVEQAPSAPEGEGFAATASEAQPLIPVEALLTRTGTGVSR